MSQDIYKKIQTNISDLVKTLGIEIHPDEIKLEHPANSDFGDISSNIALAKWKDAKKENDEPFSNPREFAQALKEKSNETNFPIDNIAGPGFLNFKIPRTEFLKNIESVISSNGNVLSNSLENKKIITEFTDPNPFKEFHIGHLYSNSVGESISRILESVGANVRRVCYQGDVGMHVAKSIWGIFQSLEETDPQIVLQKLKEMSSQTINDRIKFLGKAYAVGASAYEDDPTAKDEMKVMNKHIFEHDPKVSEIYELGRNWSLEYFETVYARLGTKFEDYYFESKVSARGVEIVQEYLKNGIFEQSQGAVIFPGSKYGLHDRVFINALGLPTYEAKELGLAPTKYEDWPYDQSIIITGNEINEYFKVLLKALSLIKPELAEKTVHLSHGMVRLPEGKMSSRKGNVLTGEWLLDEAKKMILVILDKNKQELTEQQKEEICETVSVAAIKYALLKNSIGGSIAFNFEESVSFEGNSGPYLLYTYARCRSVLRKATAIQKNQKDVTLVPEELAILRLLYQFDEIVQRAAHDFAPHFICVYLFDLAQAYNSFYNSQSILNADNEDIKNFRLQLTEATSLILKKGLHLLGIKTVEQM